MAEKELDLDAKQKGGSSKRIILLVAGVLLLVGASVGITLLLVGKDTGGGEVAAAKAPPAPEYLPLETLVVNFAQRGAARYLQVDMEVMAHNGDALSAVEQHMPVLRNDILMLLAGQQFETISTREGKEQLRKTLLETINRVLNEQAKIPPERAIQAVYFTSFVMQ